MITFGNFSFKTQKEAKTGVRNLLKSLLGQKITQDHPHFSDLNDLLKRHPEAKSKTRNGILAFFVSSGYQVGTYALYVERLDGTTVDVSWIACISGRGKTPRANLLAAMRAAIDDQVKGYAASLPWPATCAICKQSAATLHIDHLTPFSDLSSTFLAANPSHPQVFDDNPHDNRANFKECDAEFEADWRKFHAENAKLRPTCVACNLVQPR